MNDNYNGIKMNSVAGMIGTIRNILYCVIHDATENITFNEIRNVMWDVATSAATKNMGNDIVTNAIDLI